jgi:hypothetical protein
MTSLQYRSALAELGLTQLGAARVFGVAGRTSRRWASGEASIPTIVIKVLKLAIARRVLLRDIEQA